MASEILRPELQYAVEVEGSEIYIPVGCGQFVQRTHSLLAAKRAFSQQREASLIEYVDGEYYRTIAESVDAPDHDRNLVVR